MYLDDLTYARVLGGRTNSDAPLVSSNSSVSTSSRAHARSVRYLPELVINLIVVP